MLKKLEKILLISLLFIVSSCTIIPNKVEINRPSLDSKGNPTSGFLGFYTNSNSYVYGVIDRQLEEKYTFLVKKYGKNDLIRIPRHYFGLQEGILEFTNNAYLIDSEHLRKLETMNRWNKSNLPK